jgi:hypothetical protein
MSMAGIQGGRGPIENYFVMESGYYLEAERIYEHLKSGLLPEG